MAHRVQSVSMIDQNILQAIFIGGEVIQYDLRKMLSILPLFQEIINNPSLALIDSRFFGELFLCQHGIFSCSRRVLVRSN